MLPDVSKSSRYWPSRSSKVGSPGAPNSDAVVSVPAEPLNGYIQRSPLAVNVVAPALAAAKRLAEASSKIRFLIIHLLVGERRLPFPRAKAAGWPERGVAGWDAFRTCARIGRCVAVNEAQSTTGSWRPNRVSH